MIKIDGVSPDRIFIKGDKEAYRVYLDGEMIWPVYTTSSNHLVKYTWHDKTMTFGVVERAEESQVARPYYTWNEDDKTVNVLNPPKDPTTGEENEPDIEWITTLP